jgi:hypothetical protein
MAGDDPTTGEPSADPGSDEAAEPHADIVARLLEYQRRLREETGAEPPTFGAGPKPPRTADVRPASIQETESLGEGPEPVEPDPATGGSDDGGSGPTDARQLKERIDRLDETLARISAMLPLLKGEERRDAGS